MRRRTSGAIWPLLALLLSCAAGAPDRAATHVAEQARLDGTTHHSIRSQHVDQVFSIDVWAPIGVPGPLPVVYVLDGNTTFGMAYQMVMPMFFAKEIPPVIVVGVGYELASPFEVVALRSRDLLPTREPGFAERLAESGFPVPEGVEPGGADRFYRFIDEELKPFIASLYPVDSDDETLVGYSYGGTFAFHALVNHPGSFERYVIGSPVLARDDGELIADEERYASIRDALPAHVFLSAGEHEIENGILVPAEQMMKTLGRRGYRGLDLRTHVFEGETHESGIAPTLSRGLRAVFGTWPRQASH